MKVGNAISKVPGVVDVENGVDNTISGPATSFQVDPSLAARLGFTPEEISTDATAILDGIPASQPLIENGRPYTIRVRLDAAHRASLDAIKNTVFNSASGKTTSLGAVADVVQLPPQNEILRENLQMLVTVTGRLEGSDLGSAIKRVQQAVKDLHLPSSVRVEYGGTYQEQQKSFHELLRVLLLALVLVFGVLLAEFRNFSAPVGDSGFVDALDGGRGVSAAGDEYDVQCCVVHGPDYGDRYCGEERHSSAGCGRKIPRCGDASA